MRRAGEHALAGPTLARIGTHQSIRPVQVPAGDDVLRHQSACPANARKSPARNAYRPLAHLPRHSKVEMATGRLDAVVSPSPNFEPS